MPIKENIIRIRGRVPAQTVIVAVTKGRSVEEIKEALAAGITDIGENRVQEALSKYSGLRAQNSELRWHMVGHLQTNKVKDAVRIFGLIHSVDSLRLAEEIDRQAAKINKAQDILIEIKTSIEATKSGLTPEEAPDAIKGISRLKNINIKGLMTIAPVVDDPEKARPYFRQLRDLRDKIMGSGFLSMGMSDDFEIAVEEGANMVRIGRAIFA